MNILTIKRGIGLSKVANRGNWLREYATEVKIITCGYCTSYRKSVIAEAESLA